ncbi:MAG: GxxExxY protein [Anaerolineaceae bacterium]|nr:GxxExxY protein [Anaerolineaceae bacterium]
MRSEEDKLSYLIIGAAIDVHRSIGGPGLLENVYEEALCWELQQLGLSIERQKEVPIVYKGMQLHTPLRLDLLVENLVIVECKATLTYNTIFEVQTLTYLRLANLRLGLVINFGERSVKDGVHRVVNSL